MLPFAPEPDLLEARAALRAAVDGVLMALRSGVLPGDAELEHVDIKEEAGRRGSAGRLLDGQHRNTAAATQLADETACFANTPGGGALIVGIEDRTGDLLGTALDRDWLRHAIYTRVDLAPTVEERIVDGVRLLVLFVAAAAEPIEDTSGRIRWRVGTNCQPVDRSEWWLQRRHLAGYDTMAAPTSRTVADLSPGAVVAARRYLRDGGQDHHAAESAADLVRRLGAVAPDGRLTQAGALLFCPADRSHVSITAIDVEGGDVLLRPPDLRGLSLLEQVAMVDDRLASLNTEVTVHNGFADSPVRRLPATAVREAVLNGVVHRDWLLPDALEVTWIDADSTLQVISPGGFVGGITADTVLTQRHARHPALADLFRALNLVEKQGMGVGVDRMYREMVALGHRPPVIVQEAGPRVRTRLVGGRPVIPVMALTGRIEPAVRRRDVRVALIVDDLLQHPFTTPQRLAGVLQRTEREAADALDVAIQECRVNGSALLSRYKDVWMLSSAALAVVEDAARGTQHPTRTILRYRRPTDPGPVAQAWLTVHDRITSGDYATLTGLTQTAALGHLVRLIGDGVLVRGPGQGRSAHFRAGSTSGPS